jgi:hypothetical protein
LIGHLADDTEVVQSVGEIRVDFAWFGFLQTDSGTKQPLGGGQISNGGGLFRSADDRLHFDYVRHDVLRHRNVGERDRTTSVKRRDTTDRCAAVIIASAELSNCEDL